MRKYSFFFVFILLVFAGQVRAESYYVHPFLGKDANRGTSPEKPWKTLGKVNKTRFKAGDKVLFAANTKFWGSLVIRGQRGGKGKPILYATYDGGTLPSDKRVTLNAKGKLYGILVENSSHIRVSNFHITANGGGLSEKFLAEWKQKKKNARRFKTLMRLGVLVDSSDITENIHFEGLRIEDVFFNEAGVSRSIEETRTSVGTQEYGYGMRFFSQKGAVLKDVRVSRSSIRNVSHTGMKYTSRGGKVINMVIDNSHVEDVGGPGLQMSGVRGGYVAHNIVSGSGSVNDSRNWGRGSGMWTWGSHNILIEHNQFMNANGPGDSAGFHVDFNCTNIIFQYNLSANNAGGFIEILGNNHNSAYRYNVSVNDGHRIKGKNNAFQEGKIFWLSGFVGRKRKQHGPYNSYIYNNTIYVKKESVAKMAVTRTAKGVMVVNNIFHIMGRSVAVRGDQYRPAPQDKRRLVEHTVFKNNLFLKKGSWPRSIAIQPSGSFYGDAGFVNGGGLNIRDYIPQNKRLIKDRGVVVPKIPGDKVGLVVGLDVKKDILGNPIRGLPDMGAIEMK